MKKFYKEINTLFWIAVSLEERYPKQAKEIYKLIIEFEKKLKRR